MYGPGLLLADATINLILGGLLLLFPERIVAFLGLPSPQTGFYRSILGAVLVGIGVALLIEWRRSRDGLTGLGLAGAIAINLCGGTALLAWLVCGLADLTAAGRVALWLLAGVLFGISGVEAEGILRRRAPA